MSTQVLSPTILTLALLLPGIDLCAQQDAASRQERLIARKQAALEKPFLSNAKWVTDFADAKAEAKQTGKPIFAYFSRSFRP